MRWCIGPRRSPIIGNYVWGLQSAKSKSMLPVESPVLPVNLHIPDCPPSPSVLLKGLLALMKRTASGWLFELVVNHDHPTLISQFDRQVDCASYRTGIHSKLCKCLCGWLPRWNW